MSKKNKNQWYYVWTAGCGPCTKVTPVIDAMSACGLNIIKMSLQDYNANPIGGTPVRGTPSIFQADIDNNKTLEVIPSNVLGGLIELSNTAPELLKKNAAEYLKEKIGMK